jgi:peptidoglycan-associated lipoprotein
MNKRVISFVLVSLLAACASEKPKEVVPEQQPAPKMETPKETRPQSMVTPPAKVEVDPLNDPNGVLSKRSVYYPLNVDVVQDADKPLVQAHANYLKEHGNRKVKLEGNCDERGSNEYNLALGQRRADGVKKMIQLGGAKEGQLESISYGEMIPKDAGHNEAAWAKNRRTDINYGK